MKTEKQVIFTHNLIDVSELQVDIIDLTDLRGDKFTLIDKLMQQFRDGVFLVAIGYTESHSEILVSRNADLCLEFIDIAICNNTNRISIFSHNNYSDAYSTATDIMEGV